MATTYLLTCEHAGNNLPPAYASLFNGDEEVLYSHKAMDFGALRLAEHLAEALQWPLFSHSVSRLLVEANRSLGSEELFSAYSQRLSGPEKEKVLANFYFPHRNRVEAKVATEVAAGRRVCHFAIHTFTPALEGEVRKTELGILFDPARAQEKTLAKELKAALSAQDQHLAVAYNKPYPGKEDGLPTYLRQQFGAEQYAGFELEINQKFFLNGDQKIWEQTMATLTAALQQVAKGQKA